jgi:death-on-curing protein
VTGYLSLSQLLRLHEMQIRAFGGSTGVRDRGGAEAALARPQATFGGEDLYPDVEAKAAALMHSLVANHPFVDGNKRAGAAGRELPERQRRGARDRGRRASNITLAVARGEVSAEALAIWLRQRSRRREP